MMMQTMKKGQKDRTSHLMRDVIPQEVMEKDKLKEDVRCGSI